MLTRRAFIIFAFFASMIGANAAFAQSQDYDVRPDASQVTGEALTAVFAGITHEGAYNFDARGRPGIRYTEKHYDDGRVVYTEEGQSIEGQWTVTPRDTVCYVYQSDIIGGGCFRIFKLGNCYYFYSSYFMARDDELDRDYWTARSVKRGDRASCEDMIS